MNWAHVRFGIFAVAVLALPAALWATGDPRLVDLGKLVMILSPALAGAILNRGLGDRGARTLWSWVWLSAGVTLAVSAGALAAALAAGAASMPQGLRPGSPILAAAAVSGLTSVLEELGWAGGGLALAVTAFGRRGGVLILGLVWAAWHLVPTVMQVGMFPQMEAAAPVMTAAFIAACLVYRELLTVLRERAGTWFAAAAAHAAPNILIAGLMAGGMVLSDRSTDWPWFPAPGGLVFLVLALAAVAALRRVGPRASASPQP